MSNKTQGWATTAIALSAALAVVAGLVVGGGPIQARAEKRDGQRLVDLRAISANIECQFNDTGQLPEAPAKTDACPAVPPTADPNGAEYTYSRTDDRHWRVCASFERPEPLPDMGYGPDFDAEAGCITGSRQLQGDQPGPVPDAASPADEIPVDPAPAPAAAD